MKKIQINVNGNMVEGNWNEKAYNSNKGADFKRIYIDNNEMHITIEQYKKIQVNSFAELKKDTVEAFEKITLDEKIKLIKILIGQLDYDLEEAYDEAEENEEHVKGINNIELFEYQLHEIDQFSKRIRENVVLIEDLEKDLK